MKLLTPFLLSLVLLFRGATLLAQNNNQVAGTNQVKGCRLQVVGSNQETDCRVEDRLEEEKNQETDSREATLLLGDKISQRAEPTTNCELRTVIIQLKA